MVNKKSLETLSTIAHTESFDRALSPNNTSQQQVSPNKVSVWWNRQMALFGESTVQYLM